MNWEFISFDWNQARAFLAAAEEGSFSAAARVLGQTQPTIGRQVAALEEELGVVLFERIGRSIALTKSGMELLEHVQAMRDAANHISLTASGQSRAIEGMVRITASDVMSAYILPPVLNQLREEAPLLEIDVVADNDIRDLQRREADIAIRHKRPEQPELIARLVCEATASFYAAKNYLNKMGRPVTKSELSTMDFIGFGSNSQLFEHLAALGLSVSRSSFRVGSASGVVAWEMARNGLGVSIMSDEVAAMFPEMERIPVLTEPLVFPVWLTTHRELHTSRRIRLVFDHLAEFLSGHPRWRNLP